MCSSLSESTRLKVMGRRREEVSLSRKDMESLYYTCIMEVDAETGSKILFLSLTSENKKAGYKRHVGLKEIKNSSQEVMDLFFFWGVVWVGGGGWGGGGGYPGGGLGVFGLWCGCWGVFCFSFVSEGEGGCLAG